MPCRVKRRDQGSLFLSACFGGHRGRLATLRHTHPHPHSHSTPVSIIHHHEDQRKHSGVVKMSKTFKIWLGCPHLPSISLNLWATGEGIPEAHMPSGPRKVTMWEGAFGSCAGPESRGGRDLVLDLLVGGDACPGDPSLPHEAGMPMDRSSPVSSALSVPFLCLSHALEQQRGLGQ